MKYIPGDLIIGYIGAHKNFYTPSEKNRTPYLEVMHGYTKAINKASDGKISEIAIGDFLSGLIRLNPTITLEGIYKALKLADIEVGDE